MERVNPQRVTAVLEQWHEVVNVMPSAAERSGGRRGRVMERRWSVSFAAHHTLNSEVKVFWLVTVLEPRTI